MDAVGEIAPSGVSLDDVAEPGRVRAFLGPTERDELNALPLCSAEAAGSYGEAWRLPLGHAARAGVGARLALLGDPRRGDGREGTVCGPTACPTSPGVRSRADRSPSRSGRTRTIRTRRWPAP